MFKHVLKALFLFSLLPFFQQNSHADVMNLNEFMPTRMEDATVTDLHKWEIQASGRFNRDEKETHLRPNVRWGAIKRLQFEASSDYYQSTKIQQEKNSGSTHLGFQWNFNDQDDWVPSLAISPQVTFPTGKRSDGIDPSIKLIMTHTLIGTITEPIGQFNMNYLWQENNQTKSGEAKIANLLLFGYIHKISHKTSLQADFNHDYDALIKKSKNEMEIGVLYQLYESWLVGIGTGYDIKNGYFSSTLAIQKSF